MAWLLALLFGSPLLFLYAFNFQGALCRLCFLVGFVGLPVASRSPQNSLNA